MSYQRRGSRVQGTGNREQSSEFSIQVPKFEGLVLPFGFSVQGSIGTAEPGFFCPGRNYEKRSGSDRIPFNSRHSRTRPSVLRQR